MPRHQQPLAAPSAFDTGAYSEGPLGSTWTEHVKAYAAKHGLTYGQAMSAAGPSWRTQKGGFSEKEAREIINNQLRLYKDAVSNEWDERSYDQKAAVVQDMLREDLEQLEFADDMSVRDAIMALEGIFNALKENSYKIGRDHSYPGPGTAWKSLVKNMKELNGYKLFSKRITAQKKGELGVEAGKEYFKQPGQSIFELWEALGEAGRAQLNAEAKGMRVPAAPKSPWYRFQAAYAASGMPLNLIADVYRELCGDEKPHCPRVEEFIAKYPASTHKI